MQYYAANAQKHARNAGNAETHAQYAADAETHAQYAADAETHAQYAADAETHARYAWRVGPHPARVMDSDQGSTGTCSACTQHEHILSMHTRTSIYSACVPIRTPDTHTIFSVCAHYVYMHAAYITYMYAYTLCTNAGIIHM
jgi:hypothetical protein